MSESTAKSKPRKTTIRNLVKEAPNEYFMSGNSACAGCAAELGIRWALKALGPKTAMVYPASCMNVLIGLWPRTAPAVPVTNMAFAAGAAAASGVRAGYKAQDKNDINVVCWAGDGGTFDIGIQSLSGAAERETDMIFVCYDNEAYMNTGTQRSGATPFGAKTTTTPTGKKEWKKDMGAIMAAHHLPYVATACTSYITDLYDMFRKISKNPPEGQEIITGMKFIHILSPCAPGWNFPVERTIDIGKLAVKSGLWPMYTIENGHYQLKAESAKLIDPEKRIPVKEYLQLQGRFSKLKEEDYTTIQAAIDKVWCDIVGRLEVQKQCGV